MNKTYLLISHTSDRHATRHQPRTHECRRAASARPRLFLSGSDLLSSKGLLLSLHRGESALAGSLSQPQVIGPGFLQASRRRTPNLLSSKPLLLSQALRDSGWLGLALCLCRASLPNAAARDGGAWPRAPPMFSLPSSCLQILALLGPKLSVSAARHTAHTLGAARDGECR